MSRILRNGETFVIKEGDFDPLTSRGWTSPKNNRSMAELVRWLRDGGLRDGDEVWIARPFLRIVGVRNKTAFKPIGLVKVEELR